MQTKNLLIALAVVIVIGGALFMTMGNANKGDMNKPVITATPLVSEQTPAQPAALITVTSTTTITTTPSVKEFSMTAFYDAKGKWFSLKDMSVKKGDTVRVKITNTKGMHDFTIDELGVKQVLLLNEEVTVEFKADKAGDFVYYCSIPGHRAGGQWGTLHVTL